MRFLWKDVIRIGVLTAILHQRWQRLSSSGRLNARLLSSNAWSGGPCSDLCTSCMQQVTCSTMQVPTAANIKGKGTPMVSTAADSRPCDARVWCSSPFHWSWASSELAPGTMRVAPRWLPVMLSVVTVIFVFFLPKLSREDTCVTHFSTWDIELIPNIRRVC